MRLFLGEGSPGAHRRTRREGRTHRPCVRVDMWGSEPHARMQKPRSHPAPRKSDKPRSGPQKVADWTEPTALNAPYQLQLRSQELSPAPRATSPAYRSDKRRQSTPSPKAAAAPLDAMAQHWLLATLVATALALVPPATTAPGLTKLSAYVPSGPSRRPTQISRRAGRRPRPRRGLHAVDAAPARRRGAAVL